MRLPLVLLTAASVAYAETVSLFVYDGGDNPYAASIIGNDATATTYDINCAAGVDPSDCGMGPGMILIAGKTATTFKMDDGDAFHYTVICDVQGKSAVCTESAGGSEANFPGVSTSTTAVTLLPVTVTAGSITSVDAKTTTAATPAATTTAEHSTATSTSTGSSAGSTSTGSHTGSHTGTSSTPTGGVAQVTGHAGAVLGGAVIALAGALL